MAAKKKKKKKLNSIQRSSKYTKVMDNEQILSDKDVYLEALMRIIRNPYESVEDYCAYINKIISGEDT